ncbi:ABC-2 type transport system ATP-binding protein [Bacilli bacterium PM5-3]|nr:ABC-2 type transport system ATP-binding protein [Bacilli bacterium PM5-3]MDH6603616.1 ABC-2 type transport system ATP-binding protein [Bacilli bacterium PM5-9]
MLEVTNLGFKYNEEVIFEDVNIDIELGHIYGLIGPNGSGKTTLFNCLSSYYYPNRGEIKFEDVSIENNSLYLKEVILLGENFYFGTDTIMKLAKKLAVLYNKSLNKNLLIEIVNNFNLKSNLILRRLSKGQRKLAIICIALALKPKYLFLDEFLDGIDIVNRKIMKDMLLDYVVDNNASIIISSHTTDDIKDICDQLIMINNKTIQFQSNFDEVQDMYVTYQIISDEKLDEDFFAKMNIDVKGYRNFSNIYWVSVRENIDFENIMNDKNIKDIRKINTSIEEVIYYEFTA